MQPDDILRIARDAGIRIAGPMDSVNPSNVYAHELLRFAYQLIDAEREECAKVCDGIANDYDGSPEGAGSDNCAAEIRAMGEK